MSHANLGPIGLVSGTNEISEEGEWGRHSGPIKVEGLRLGNYWYGARITNKDLIGKVVLVETWGS